MTTMLAYLGSPAQWLLLAVVCLVIFGAKRLPDLARQLGRFFGEFTKARREFESALHEAAKEDKTAEKDEDHRGEKDA